MGERFQFSCYAVLKNVLVARKVLPPLMLEVELLPVPEKKFDCKIDLGDMQEGWIRARVVTNKHLIGKTTAAEVCASA